MTAIDHRAAAEAAKRYVEAGETDPSLFAQYMLSKAYLDLRARIADAHRQMAEIRAQREILASLGQGERHFGIACGYRECMDIMEENGLEPTPEVRQ